MSTGGELNQDFSRLRRSIFLQWRYNNGYAIAPWRCFYGFLRRGRSNSDHPRIVITISREHAMAQWTPFEFEDNLYDLSHLEPVTLKFHQPIKGEKPEKTYEVQISYSNHCFTRNVDSEEEVDSEAVFPNPVKKGDKRVFSVTRYTLSKQLPEIIRTLDKRTCYHTNHSTFLTIEITTEENARMEYEVYFKVYRGKEKQLHLIVQSAYVRDDKHKTNRPRKKKINFFVILYNTMHDKAIRKPY